jgi:hypothetical protein
LGWHGEECLVIYMWKSHALSKVLAFSLKFLLDRIPASANLAWRNVLPPDVQTSCVLCNSQNSEGASHLFLHCTVVDRIWSKIMRWLVRSFGV